MADKVQKVKDKIEKDHGIFFETLYPMGVAELSTNLLQYTKFLEETKNAISSSDKVKKLQEVVKEKSKPYDTVIKQSISKVEQLKKFVDDSICKEDLELQMIKYTMIAEDFKIKKDNCPDLQYAKDELSEIKGPLANAKKTLE